MNRKKYHKLLVEYKSLLEEKEYNPYYADAGRLTDTEEKLLCILKVIRRELEAELVSCINGCQRAGIKNKPRLKKLWRKIVRISSLYNKIVCREPVSEADYENTYYYRPVIGSIISVMTAVGIVLLSGIIWEA